MYEYNFTKFFEKKFIFANKYICISKYLLHTMKKVPPNLYMKRVNFHDALPKLTWALKSKKVYQDQMRIFFLKV